MSGLILIFDMDGTLTNSSERINKSFQKYLIKVFSQNNCAIVSGASYESIKKQIGCHLCYSSKWVFACNGAHVVQNGVTKHKSDWALKRSVKGYLRNYLQDSAFPHRTGKHFDDRIGMCNFSILGRNASKDQRRHYVAWDTTTKERRNIAVKINKNFTNLVARVAGETGIDLMPSNMSKAVVLNYVEKNSVKFFGDKMEKEGNDYPLANLLNKNQCYPVKSWEDTYRILCDLGF